MKFIYNIDFELAGLLFILVIYIHFCLYYSSQSKINQKFKVLAKYLMLAELMDIVTAVMITYGSVIPPILNVIANTLYFTSSFSLAYAFVQYVESCVDREENEKSTLSVNKVVLMSQLLLLFLNMFTGFIFYFNQAGEYMHGTLFVIFLRLS